MILRRLFALVPRSASGTGPSCHRAITLALAWGGAMILATPVLATPALADDWLGIGRIELGEEGSCTGTLIGSDLVLTAAHCLHDPRTGQVIPDDRLSFHLGWRNGKPMASRTIARTVSHPDYRPDMPEDRHNLSHDLALLELDRPVHLPGIYPYATTTASGSGDLATVIAHDDRDRREAIIRPQCRVLERRQGLMVLNCGVDFGASGAPVMYQEGPRGLPMVASVVVSKGLVDGHPVTLGLDLARALPALLARWEHISG